MITKIYVTVDRSGRPLALLSSASQRADITQAEDLLYAAIGRANMRRGDQGKLPTCVIADKAYDANIFVALLGDYGITAVIPSWSNRIGESFLGTEILCQRGRLDEDLIRHYVKYQKSEEKKREDQGYDLFL